jgi:hypothetical protein
MMTSETAMSESPSGIDPLPGGEEGRVCSARGCRRPASTDLRWNNPKIHTADRRKHWLACDEHRSSLSAFLSARGFLRETEPLPDPEKLPS